MMYDLNAASACNLSTVDMLLIAGVDPSDFYANDADDDNEERV